jgi:selenocysteine-specific elongation factor
VPSTLSPVDTIDAEVRLLKSAPGLKHRASVHFHAFTAETMASISLYSYEPVQPGTVRLMRIKLAEPIVLVPGDRFVLRLPSPAATIGGGRVLDAHPESRQRKAATLAWLEKLRTSSPTQQIVRRVGRRKTQGITLDALSAETGLIQEAVRRHAAHAIESGDLLFINGDLLLGREAFHAAADAIMAYLQIGQGLKSALDTGLSGPGKSPLRLKSSELAPLRGDSELASWREGEFSRRHLKSSELRSQTGLSPEVFQFVINSLVCERKVDLSGEMVSIHFVGGKSSDAGTIAETERLAAIGEAYESAGLAAPSVVELAERFKLKEADMRRFVTMLQRDKTIVRMGSDNLFIHSGALAQLAAQLAPLRGSLIDVARFKQLTGLSRKYAIPLLEYLDRQRITRIQGDRRLIL